MFYKTFSQKILFQYPRYVDLVRKVESNLGQTFSGKVGSLLKSIKNSFKFGKIDLLQRRGTGGRFEDQSRTPSNNSRLSRFKKPKVILLVLGVTGLVALVYLGKASLGGNKGGGNDTRVSVKAAKAVQELNKELEFPIINDEGEEVNKIKFVIVKAELVDEIVDKGQRATAVAGRTFLILTLKIVNEYSQAIEINTADYVRLSINRNEKEWLAPEINYDPLKVRAISTKYTRLGFPINETDDNLVLRVGEINGEKQNFAISFD